jgi:hypothetical protein
MLREPAASSGGLLFGAGTTSRSHIGLGASSCSTGRARVGGGHSVGSRLGQATADGKLQGKARVTLRKMLGGDED